MSKSRCISMMPRVAHFFRDVNLRGGSRPEFVPESFTSNSQPDDDIWSATFLLRTAIRMGHIWATYGVRDGKRTIPGNQPAVCFGNFTLAELIAVRKGFSAQSSAVTQYAITVPLAAAARLGIQPVIKWTDGRPCLQDGTLLEDMIPEDSDNQYRFICENPTSNRFDGSPEWRWRFNGNYQRNVEAIEANGFEGCTIPGLNITQEKLSGMGVVVPDIETARMLQYDILSLIDRGLISDSQFDHILVCDQLPDTIDGLDEEELKAVFSKACFDFKACLKIHPVATEILHLDFASRVLLLESSTAKARDQEQGGCWLWFEDNTERYVRALVNAGRIKVNKKGRYLASLDELFSYRGLREREQIAIALSEQLQKQFGIRSSYFSVLNSYSPDDEPSYAGRVWGGGYYITARPEGSDD